MDPTPQTAATITRLEVRTALADLAGEWDDLVSSQPLPSGFLHSWWVDHAAGGTPAVLVCRDGDRLVGGAAFELDRVGPGAGLARVRMLGQGPLAPDHLDLVAAPGAHLAVARSVTGWLRRRGSRMLDLDGLAAGGTLAAVFEDHVVDRVAAPVAEIGDDAEAYLGSLPGQLRNTVKRAGRRLEKAGADVVTVDGSDPEAVERALGDLARLHDHRWADESGFLSSWERFADAASTGIEQGSVLVHQLVDVDGSVVATELDLVAGGSIQFYQAGRRTEHEWRGAGSVLRAEVIRRAVAQGLSEYDLLRGDEAYKAGWATDRRELVRVRVGIGVGGRGALAAAALSRAVSQRRRPPRPEPSD